MSAASDPLFEFLKIAVPAALVVIGWLVLIRNSSRIEARKEIKNLIDIIVNTIDEIGSDSIVYFDRSNLEHSGHLSNKITTNFSLISHYLFILEGCGVKFVGTQDLVDFKKTVTGSYFQTKDYLKQTEIPGWASELAANQAKLKLSVNRSYFAWTGAYSQKRLKKRLGKRRPV
jgi:hypothetical protein